MTADRFLPVLAVSPVLAPPHKCNVYTPEGSRSDVMSPVMPCGETPSWAVFFDSIKRLIYYLVPKYYNAKVTYRLLLLLG